MIAAPDEETSEEEEEDDGTSDFTLGAILGLDGGKDCAFRKQDRERVECPKFGIKVLFG